MYTFLEKNEIISAVINWRNTSQTGSIDDLRQYLHDLYVCDFWALGFGSLEEFLIENKFTVLEVKTKVVFNPPGVQGMEKEKREEGEGDENECIICMEKGRDSVVVGCGHFCMCMECAMKYDKCPVCRGTYSKDQVIRVFVA